MVSSTEVKPIVPSFPPPPGTMSTVMVKRIPTKAPADAKCDALSKMTGNAVMPAKEAENATRERVVP